MLKFFGITRPREVAEFIIAINPARSNRTWAEMRGGIFSITINPGICTFAIGEKPTGNNLWRQRCMRGTHQTCV
ncbi:hypothetical protein J7M23_11160 [Candidatus Sumerlaeota bacterium]|nr:hypothetical protein [Candidatus Sumerlaeota bacterium]